MTWIKPSFLWMMYRSGWAAKPGQERILSVRITRIGFEQALRDACLSHYDADIHPSQDNWLRRKQDTTVRVQWDPERSLHLDPLPWRAIQIGLSGSSVHQYVSQWIIDITDITQPAREVQRLLREGNDTEARHRLPVERPYPLPAAVGTTIGADEPT
jgi:hypothetical protein